ncbi:MAG TPA: DUF2637 domain-containing protein [Streptosporangiaceae bacterium]|nr:DUF2637 domain-containing protein [Streptosporangiaceae bacterium]
MSAADRAIRWSTVAAVAGVALVAGWVSYLHAWDVVSAHGEAGPVGRLYPGTIDGLIYAASMVLLDAARRGVPAPRLARWLLAAGIGATLAANVLAGATAGVLGAVVAAWPALALVGSYELLMVMIRGQASQTAPADAAEAVRMAYRASLAAGAPLSQRAMARRFGLSRRRVSSIAAEVTAETGGTAPGPRPGWLLSREAATP